ncbi:hypothetical protein [Mycobacteroides abscessus]|uniref:hypothetical protein n=1 Tax=Mycobacteroides abscessus TaxID=36809 RepID=UPI0013F4E4B2|nr:hypothetical protein [Mycobacteroides abscessus]
MPNAVKIEIADTPGVIATEPAPLAVRGAAVLGDLRSALATQLLQWPNLDDLGL